MPLVALDSLRVDRTGSVAKVFATKRVSERDAYLSGHFPDLCVFPGVFILETVREAVAAVLVADAAGSADLVGVKSARFLAPVLSGDTLSVAFELPDPPPRTPINVEATCTRSDGTRVAHLKLQIDIVFE
jgi:3-hydroxyacyl-[acyl-carrier-protein] dehydratase